MKLTGVISFFVTLFVSVLISTWWEWVRVPTCGLRLEHGMSFAAYASEEAALLTLASGGLCLGFVVARLARRVCCH